MPGNDIPENIHNFFEQDNTSEGRQAQGGGWPVFDNNPWASRQNGGPFGINSNNYASQSLVPEQGNGMQPVQTPFGSNQILNPEVVRSHPSNLQLNLNGYMHGSQGIQASSFQANSLQGGGLVSDSQSLMQRNFSNFEAQQSSSPGDISGLTKGINRSEPEAPVNFDFLGGQQMLSRQIPGISQPRPIQPQKIGDMQLWQQQLIYKQIQEMQRKQLLQQFQHGGRQQLPPSQLSEVGRQASSNQVPAILNGMPINNASDNIWASEHLGGDQRLASSSAMFLAGNIDRLQRAESSMQGIPNGLMFSRDQGQAVRSMGFSPQHSDQSLYGTPVASAKGSPSHQSQFQGAQEKALMQTSAVNYFQSEQPAVPRQGYLQDNVSLSKQGFEGKNLLQDATAQGLSTASGNFEEMNRFSQTIQVQEMSGMLHEKAGGQGRSSHVVANLDPTEEKLLFNTDDGNQDASFAGNNEKGTGGYFHGNLSQSNDYFSSLPTLNSGSWSALMQEAVEASSSETGLNEEWSGLSFQKTEISPGNHGAMLPNNSNQQATWNDGNLRNASRPLPLFNDVSESPNCHATTNMQQSLNFSPEQSERVSADVLRESFQRPSTEATNNPFRQSRQQKQLSGSNNQDQAQFGNMFNGGWTGQTYEQAAGSSHSSEVELNSQNMQNAWPHHRMTPRQSHPSNQLNGWNTLSLGATGNNASKLSDNDSGKHLQKNDMKSSMSLEGDQRGSMWKGAGTTPTSFPSSAARTETTPPDTATMQNRDSSTDNLVAIMNPNNLNVNRETDQQILGRHHGKHHDAYLNSKNEEDTIKYQNQVSGIQQTWDSSMHERNSGGSYRDRQGNSHQESILREGFTATNSQPSQNREGGGTAGGNSAGVGSDARSTVNSSLKPAGQTDRKTAGPRRFQFHPMGNLEMSREPVDSSNHTSFSQGFSQSVIQGMKTQDQGHAARSQISGHVFNNTPDLGKGHSNDLQRNAKAAEEFQYRGTISSHPTSSALDGSIPQCPQDQRTGLASRNMLELLHKVDQTRVGQTVEGFSFPEQNAPSGIPSGDASDASASHLQLGQSSALQGFGLKLGPPSQRQSASDHSLASQASVETTNSLNQRNVEAGAREEDQTRASFSSIHSPSLPHSVPQKANPADKSFLPEHTRNEGMYSNFHGSSSAATPYKPRMDQSLTPQQQQQLLWQQQQKQQQLLWHQQQKQQLHFASATRPPPSNQLPFLPFGRQVGVGTKQSHNGAISDQSSKELMPSAAGGVSSSRLVPSPDAHPSSTSQFYPVSTVSSQLRNASSHIGSSGQQASVMEIRSSIHPATSTVSQQAGSPTVLHNVWTSVSSRQRLSGLQPQKIITDVPVPQKPDNFNKRKGESSELDMQSTTSSHQFPFDETRLVKDNSSQQMQPKRETASQGPEQEPEKGQSHREDLSKGNYAQDSTVDTDNGQVHVTNMISSGRDTGTHGQSLEPSEVPKQNSYSLLQQMQAMKDAESDPSRRAEKRLKGADSGADTKQIGWAPGQRYNYAQRESLREMAAASQNIPFSSDVRMLSFSSRDNHANSTNSSLQVSGREAQAHVHGKASLLPFAGGNERPQISPQMAPSWFEKYGSYRSGQAQTVFDGLGNSQRSLKATEQTYVVSKVPESMAHHAIPEQRDDAGEVGGLQQSTSPNVLASHQPATSPSHSPVELIDNNISLIRKKRKTATSDLLPFYKEVTQGCQRLQIISTTEQRWAWVTNRLIDKLEEDFDPIEDGVSKSRSRRRLILTTQLMQQILPSVPAACIRKDAITSYESVTYLMARSILGEVCSLASCSESDTSIDADSESKMLKTASILKKRGHNHFSRSMEVFMGKSKKLKDDFLRLERGASLLDVRLDCQELEKHSIVNHFARFLGRSQSERIDNSLTSEAVPHRVFPQRHVTEVISKNLPEGVNCLSL